MKKRLPVVLLATLVLAAVFGTTAFAASAQDIVNTANTSIAQQISLATAQADQATDVYNTTVAAVQNYGGPQSATLLALCYALYDTRLDQISSTLVSRTNQIARKAIADAAALGVTVVCQYEQVTLGDRVVLVDPLIVVSD